MPHEHEQSPQGGLTMQSGRIDGIEGGHSCGYNLLCILHGMEPKKSKPLQQPQAQRP